MDRSKLQLSILSACVVGFGTVDIQYTLGDVYFGGNSYMTYNPGRNILAGLESSFTVTFTYCNNKGILLYKDDSVGFFALGVHTGRIYLEWKTNSEIVEVKKDLIPWMMFLDVASHC